MDEAHRFRTRGTQIGEITKADGILGKMYSRENNMPMVSSVLSLEPQHKWMLMATPLVNGIKDLHWILQFLRFHPG
jgi:hypothetical protein